MKRVIGIGLLSALGLAALFLWWAFVTFGNEIRADIRGLVNEASRDFVMIDQERLASLPLPAQRYFEHAGIAGKTIPRIIRVKQKGRIRSSVEAGWMDFEAEEFYSTNPPAYVWRAFLPKFTMPFTFGRDEYLGGKGSILFKMMAMSPVTSEFGDELGEAGLARYLNEMTAFPAAYLGDNVKIDSVDADTFKVTITDHGMTASAMLSVGPDGRLTGYTADRLNTSTRTKETWETPYQDYRTFEGVEIPSRGTAIWKLKSGDFDYFETELTEVKYDEELDL